MLKVGSTPRIYTRSHSAPRRLVFFAFLLCFIPSRFPRHPSDMLLRSLVPKFLACCLWIACAFWYARSHFFRDPGSAFFDKARAYEQRYSRYRKGEVERYVDSFGDKESQIVRPKTDDNAGLCVSLSSVRRERAQYLEVRFS